MKRKKQKLKRIGVMGLTFSNFKQVIPDEILARGRDYMRNGQILDLSFDEETMLWEAQVEGTEVYDVRVEQAENNDLSCSCTCPYDMGPYCKHIAALLYAIEDGFADYIGVKPRKKPSKRQTKHEKLRQLLEKTSREQLVTVLLDLTQQDRELLNQLLLRLNTGEVKPADYRRAVKAALRTGRGDYGFLDYTGSNRAAAKIQDLLTQADRWIESNELDKAIAMYQSVLDETTQAITNADDSSGMLGQCITGALDGLRASAELQDEAGREALFTYCLDRVRRKEFHDWDWGWEMLTIVAAMVDTPARRVVFTSVLDDLEAEYQQVDRYGFYNTYRIEDIALLRLSMIERLDGAEAARTFLQNHTDLHRLRKVLIERDLAEDRLDEAQQLIDEGIAATKENRLPGLTVQYQMLQVKLLQKGGDKQTLIATTRALWLNRPDEESFALLKRTVPQEEWAAFVDGLIADVKRRPEQLAWLYAHENQWDNLLALVLSGRESEWLIESYRQPLESRFPKELADVYERFAAAILVHASGRNHYKHAVAYLRRIQKLNQPERVEAIVSRLKSQYANRPAFLDELRKL
jgi:hypothetical protein